VLKEETVSKFVSFVIHLSRLIVGTSDDFLVKKLQSNLAKTISLYTGLAGNSTQNVAQYTDLKKELLYALDSLLDILDYIGHMKAANPLSLRISKFATLRFKLLVVKTVSNLNTEKELPRGRKQPADVLSVRTSARKSSQKRKELNPSQEKIFNYIRNTKDARTKEIIDEFSLLSERTVKRNLKELVGQGLLRKRSENKAVYYSTTNGN